MLARFAFAANTNYGSHLPVKGKSNVMKDMLARAGQLEKGIPYNRGDRVPNPTDAPIGEQVTRLNELLIREDFFERRSDLEEQVDRTLLKIGAGGPLHANARDGWPSALS